MTATLTATLTATPDQRAALDRKKLQSRLHAVRGRAEALPQLNLGGLLAGAQNKLDLLRFKDCADVLDDVDDRIERHQRSLEEAEMAAAGQAQDQLLAESGIDTDRHDSTGAGTRHGFMWLERKGRVSGRRRIAGQNWGRDYAMAKLDSLRSCLNDNAPGGGPGDSQQSRKSEARANLDRGREHIRFATGSEALANLLDAVCGRGDTLRGLSDGDKIGAAVKEAELMIALDMAAEAYSLTDDRPIIQGGRAA